MSKRPAGMEREARGFLMRLLRDVRGNTLALMTAALIPLAGLVGGGLDLSRMYILKTRLQHACDAGALAGRRAMGGGTWAYDDGYPGKQAEMFFKANFTDGSYGSFDTTKAFTENAGKVTGTASAQIPMTLMRIFGEDVKTLDVTCDAEMRLPNTDVMFVLDTTGSMSSRQPGDTVSKMQALRVAVKCFYEIVARLDTDADCDGGAPSGGTGSEVQVRFGFVPYSTNVNVGRLLPATWFADEWKYQTRKVAAISSTFSAWEAIGAYSCSAFGNTSLTEYREANRFWVGRTAYCNFDMRSKVTWTYDQFPVNIAPLKNGSGWNASFKLPIGQDGGDKTIEWDGCIEERATVRATDYDPIPSGAKDLDIDMVPTGDVSTQWAPALNDVIYTRQSMGSYNESGGSATFNRAAVSSTIHNYINRATYFCPAEAKKLQMWPAAGAFDDYVDTLQPTGNTYHDIGLLWGARLASPTGLFRSENEFTPKGGEIERHMIFMTDGDACTVDTNYTAYGVAWFDRRQTPDADVPTEGCTYNSNTLTEQVNKRTEALCTAVKNKNFTLWVIAFGDLATETETRLKNCATSGRYFKATGAAALQKTFKQIADQISMLRLTN